MGFIPDIERIFQLTPFTRQTLFFSATMAPEIERITNTFLHAPARIEVARQATTSETITQKLIQITPPRRDQAAKAKRELLRAIIKAEGEACTNAIIFCNRKTDVDIVAKSLKSHGFNASPIHGDLEQSLRTKTLDAFRDGSLQLLIASDVAARGLDIPAVSHVFNYDLPSHAEDYVHRIGRTGRAGRLGTAISIGTPADAKYLGAIEALVKKEIPRADPPEGFTLSDAAHREPKKYDDDRGPRAGRSTRSRGGRDRDRDEKHRDEKRPPREERLPVIEAVEESSHIVDVPETRRPEPVRSRAPAQTRTEMGRDERRDHGGRGRDGAVIGMGDHVPDFLMRPFRPTKPLVEEKDSDAEEPPVEIDEPSES